MNTKEFINNVLIKEIKSIQQENGYHYISFGLISQGIEFLGACLDNYKFDAPGKSRERFNKSINELFPSEYHKFVKSNFQKALLSLERDIPEIHSPSKSLTY